MSHSMEYYIHTILLYVNWLYSIYGDIFLYYDFHFKPILKRDVLLTIFNLVKNVHENNKRVTRLQWQFQKMNLENEQQQQRQQQLRSFQRLLPVPEAVYLISNINWNAALTARQGVEREDLDIIVSSRSAVTCPWRVVGRQEEEDIRRDVTVEHQSAIKRLRRTRQHWRWYNFTREWWHTFFHINYLRGNWTATFRWCWGNTRYYTGSPRGDDRYQYIMCLRHAPSVAELRIGIKWTWSWYAATTLSRLSFQRKQLFQRIMIYHSATGVGRHWVNIY